MNQSGAQNTTVSFLRSVSVISDFEDEDDEFETLSPLDEADYTTDGVEVTGALQHFKDEDGDTLPYTSVQQKPVAFDDIRDNCWIPTVPVEVNISEYERQGTQVLNPNLYTIHVKHGQFTWIVKKRYKHIRHLHEQLSLYRAKHSIPLPTRDNKEKRKTFHREKLSVKFPLRPEALVSNDAIPKRMKLLEKYLQSLLKCKLYRNHNETIKFFEVSQLSFVKALGHDKGKEGMIKKCSGGRPFHCCCCGLKTLHLFGTYDKRWLVLKDTYLAYIRPEDGYVRDVILMDSHFKVECGMASTGAHHGLLITNFQRKLLLKCWTSRKAREWAERIREKAKTRGIDFTFTNRFKAFAPARESSYAHWFVDAANYFEAVAESLEKAKEEIFITDWWLSPEIYMKRPMTEGDKWRLDMILKRKADAGVKIYILLYKEVKMALGIDSNYSKTTILRLNSENIKIMRHPDHNVPGSVLLWAHHEKMVVIDQKVAFLGGIDLCYGRWDTCEHKLTDLGSIQLKNMGRQGSIISLPDASVFTQTTADYHSRDSVDAIELDDPNDVHISITPATPDREVAPPIPSNYHDKDTENEYNKIMLKNIPQKHVSSDNVYNDFEFIDSDQADDRSHFQVEAEVNHNDQMDNVKTETKNITISDNNNVTLETKKKSVHLWIQNAENKVIGKSKIEKQEKVVLKSVKNLHVSQESEHMTVAKRHSSESHSSETSQTDLIKSSAGITEAASSRVNLNGMASVVRTNNMLERLKKQEVIEEENPARRRWKMIIHKKSELASNQDGQQEHIKEKYLSDNKRSTFRHTKFSNLVERIRDRRGSLDLPPDINSKQNLEINKRFQRTDSEIAINEQGLQGSTKLWIGKDYVNFIHKDFVQLDSPFTDFIERHSCPRMPWHDIGAVVYGKSARDVARHFIARWNYTKNKKFKKKTTYPLLMPRNYGRCTIPMSIKGVTYEVKSQILRSACNWSAGLGEIEASIHTAYLHCIENSKHYIYIENQFFVTQIDDENNSQNTVLNGIGDALYRRIIRAHRSGDVFRVYVVMPLLPAFEGEFGTAGGVALQAVTNWNYASICRGPHSLIERLSQEVADPLKYVVFCGLRKHAELNGKMMTELVYVHSKLMIVDDDTVIIGSANINDRSLLGKRDSELAVMVEDVKKTPVTINGKEHFVGRFASSLRTTLFREHLGLVEDDNVDITDIVCDSFYKELWIRQAAINTTVYDVVFRCIPCDYVQTFQQLKEYTAEPGMIQTDPSTAHKKLKDVKGQLVLLPREFLKFENLAPAIGTKEQLLPAYLWT